MVAVVVAYLSKRDRPPVKPRSLIRVPGTSESGSGQLLGVETIRTDLRIVLADGQRVGQRLAGKLVAESGEIVETRPAFGNGRRRRLDQQLGRNTRSRRHSCVEERLDIG